MMWIGKEDIVNDTNLCQQWMCVLNFRYNMKDITKQNKRCLHSTDIFHLTTFQKSLCADM